MAASKDWTKHLKDDITANIEDSLKGKMDEIDAKLVEITGIAKVGATLKVEIAGKTKGKLEGLRHVQVEGLLRLCALRENVLLVGMAGTGKTHAAEQAAQGLKLPFYAISVGAQTSKSDIIGYMNASGGYVQTLFRKAYEEGGVFLMDEIDAGNANVLIQVNAALSNHYCAFPDSMVKRHKDFVFVASANTYGNGANRMYVGRNQLDAATLDRFTVMNWEVDEQLEKQLCSNLGWLKVVQKLRKETIAQQLRALITPRATLRGDKMLAAGMPFAEVLDLAILNAYPTDKREWARAIALKVPS